MSTVAMDDDSLSLDSGEENTFISKIIGEMKNTFNKTDKRQVPPLEIGPSTDSNNLTEININSRLTEMSAENSPERTETENDLQIEVKIEPQKTDTAVQTLDSASTYPLEENTVIEANIGIEDNKILFDSVVDSTEIKQESELEEDGDTKPRIVMYFRKPASNLSPKTKKNAEEPGSPDRRSSRNKIQEESELKRSVRRRRSRDYGESVLQTAIARKEKSYNEASKPQRSTRQLKPTPKILENLANAAAIKEKNKVRTSKSTEKQKNDSESDIYTSTEESAMHVSGDSERLHKKHKHKHHVNKCSKRVSKKFKSDQSDVGKDSDSDVNVVQETNECDGSIENGKTDVDDVQNKTVEEKHFRRSQRISSSRCKEEIVLNVDDVETPEASLAEQESMYPADPECSSVGAQLIASKLCLCAQPTKLYASIANKDVFCMAVDSVGEKLVGCNNLIDGKEVCMLRPSSRVPYAIFCDVHKNRMLRHNCCPTCGLFCTQGTFVECAVRHQYHRECQISVGNIECCPHCGISTPDYDVHVTMYSSKKPVFLPKQRKSYPLAKITFQQNSYDDIKPSVTPLVPTGAVQIQFSTVSNGSGEICDVDSIFQVIKEGNYGKLANILGSRSVGLMSELNYDGCTTVLHYSAKNGLLPAVHMLLTAGMELDILDKEQNTPLMVAVLAFKNDVVKYLIKAGASIVFKGMDGMTAVHLAAQYGNLEACELLLDAAINKREYINCGDDGGWTPLVWACEHNRINIVQYLLRKGADPLLRDLKHNTALHWSAFSGCQEIMQLLLKYGSDVSVVNAQGDTPLHIGARQGNYNAVIILLIRGADVTSINKVGESALDCTEQYSDCYNIILLNIHLQSNAQVKSGSVILTNDISLGKELNPIQCLNLVDDEQKPANFVYITENCVTSDVDIDRKITGLQSCVCEDNCNSGHCLCSTGGTSPTLWYDEEGRLLPHFNFADAPMIFECNQLCLCNALTCYNRVVQRGLSQRFQVFRTETKGWGIKTLNSIARGSFICEYIGEIVNDVDADQREDDCYMFDLDNRGESETFCIDAKHYGNLSRFINHSCEPNLVPIKVFIEHQDLRFPKIAFFANRDILANEEISFDYGEKFWIVKYKSYTCDCRSLNCKYSEEAIHATLENYQLRFRELEC